MSKNTEGSTNFSKPFLSNEITTFLCVPIFLLTCLLYQNLEKLCFSNVLYCSCPFKAELLFGVSQHSLAQQYELLKDRNSRLNMCFRKRTQFFLALDQILDLFCIKDIINIGQSILCIFHMGRTNLILPFLFVVLM